MESNAHTRVLSLSTPHLLGVVALVVAVSPPSPSPAACVFFFAMLLQLVVTRLRVWHNRIAQLAHNVVWLAMHCSLPLPSLTGFAQLLEI